MGVVDLCGREPPAVGRECTVADAIQLMLTRRVGAVAVVDANGIVGIFTERDAMKLALSGCDLASIQVAALMSASVETVAPSTSAGDALALMMGRQCRHLLVVDPSGKLLGIVSIEDLLQAQVADLREQLDSLEQYVSNDSPGG